MRKRQESIETKRHKPTTHLFVFPPFCKHSIETMPMEESTDRQNDTRHNEADRQSVKAPPLSLLFSSDFDKDSGDL